MRTVQLHQPILPLDAAVRVPGSKSITNRALICAALAEGTSVVEGASDSEDTALMANALNQLGVLVQRKGETLSVEGRGGRLFAPKLPIPVGNAGTTFRFLLSLAALAQGRTTFSLSPRMAERPIEDLTAALHQAGVSVTRDPSGLFVSVDGGGLRGRSVRMSGERSSQFLSSLLLAAPYAAGRMEVRMEGRLVSAPYLAMTTAVMRAFGVDVATPDESLYRVENGVPYSATRYRVEPDASAATYPLAAAAIAGGRVTVPGLRERSLQGDARFVSVLEEVGCTVVFTPEGVTAAGTGHPRGINVDLNEMPDTVPTLVAVALFASGPAYIRNIGQLRHKESNRLETLAQEFGKLGALVQVRGDGLAILPAALHGAVLSPHEDHRLAMSFALAGLRVPGIAIGQADCVRKSFPGFWDEYGRLTGSPVSFT